MIAFVAAIALVQSPLSDRIEARLTELHKVGSFPGMTAAWTLADGRTESVAIGVSDKESGRKMQSGDRMLAGSIGKMYFAAAIMRLVEAGRFDLDRKAAYYLGDQAWFKRIPNASTVTIKQLLNHTSGVPEHVESPEFVSAVKKSPDKTWTPAELLSFVLDKKPLFSPGTDWAYADTNYILASAAAETVAKRPLYQVIQQDILKPLGLSQTSPSTSPRLPGLVQGYSMPNSPFGFAGPVLKDGVYFAFNPQMEWAGGGFVSTSADLSRWAKALYEGKVVTRASVQEMVDAVPAKTGRGDKYGIGTQVRTSDFGPSYGHGGWFPGYLSEVEYFPDFKISVAVQFNTDDMRAIGGRPRKFTLELARLVSADILGRR